MNLRSRFVPLVLACMVANASCVRDEPMAVTLSSPADGVSVAGGVELLMEADGITIEKAGEARDGGGHFHVVVDAGCVDAGDAIPRDADHVHFGGGQNDGVVYLESGTHELCLQAGDGEHVALGATDRVTIEVGVDTEDEWCSVVGEVDALFESVDNSSDDFATKKLGYEAIRRLLSQLSSAIDLVDEDARPDVHASLAFGANVAVAFTTAADVEEAEEALAPLFDGIDEGLPGAAWVLETCEVDING